MYNPSTQEAETGLPCVEAKLFYILYVYTTYINHILNHLTLVFPSASFSQFTAFILFEAGSHFESQANLESSASSSQVLRLQNVPSCPTSIFKGLFKTLAMGSVPGILPTQLTPSLCQTPLPGCNSNNYKIISVPWIYLYSSPHVTAPFKSYNGQIHKN